MTPDEEVEEIKRWEGLNPDEEYEENFWKGESDPKIKENADKNIAKMKEGWGEIYRSMEDDWNVYNLDQWSSAAGNARQGRPKVTMDQTRKYVKKVVAQAYETPPGVKLTPRSDGASLKSKAFAESIRYFEDRSGASNAYSAAVEGAAVGGLGWIKVTYESDEDQGGQNVLVIDRVVDRLSIYIDEESTTLDGSDMRYAVEYHNAEGTEYTYWYIDEEGLVKWCHFKDDKLINKDVWPDLYIPIIPVYGEITTVKGKLSVFGIIRQIKEIQRNLNYALSEAAERLATAPKSTFMAATGQIPDDRRADYDLAISGNISVLEYDPVVVSGINGESIQVQAPFRSDTAPDMSWVPSIVEIYTRSMQEATGIDTSMEKRNVPEANATLVTRNENSDRGQLVYDANLKASVQQVGRVMLGLIETVIGPNGMIPLMAEDGTKSFIPFIDPASLPRDMMGNPVPPRDQAGNVLPFISDLNASDVDISVSSAPAFATRKKEGIEKTIALMGNLSPEQQAKVVPKLISMIDFPQAQEIASALDPSLAEGAPDPALLQQQMAEMEAQLKQASTAINDLQTQNMQLNMELAKNTRATLAKAQMDNQTKIEIEQMKQTGKLTDTQMRLAAGSISDDKKIISDQNIQSEENRLAVAEMANETQLEVAKMEQQADKENAEIALKANKQQQEMLDSFRAPPTYPMG